MAIILVVLVYTISCVKVSNKKGRIVKDCTGTYFRYEGKDYHVCNTEMTDLQKDSNEVTVTFKKLKECKGTAQNAVVCEMLHKNEGWIEIVSIR